MIYKNAEFYNVADVIKNSDGSVTWLRIPKSVYNNLETGEQGKMMAKSATGVEIRFVLKGENAVIKMSSATADGRFHIYRGGVQGGWYDMETDKIVTGNIKEFEIKRMEEQDKLKIIHERTGLDWDDNVIRVIFDAGVFNIYDINGDIEPPKKKQCPKRTMLCYGSSITHGSNSIDMSHSWASVLGYNLNVDVRNLGMAGSCWMEPDFVEYIADEGKKGKWDFATLELGVNVLGWDDAKFRERVENTIVKIAGKNPDKAVFVISPFYLCEEDFNQNCKAGLWREIIENTVNKLNYPNVTYINGLDVLGDMTGISADFTHPNIYGIQQMSDRLTNIIKNTIK